MKIDWNDRDGPECFFGLSLGEVLAIEITAIVIAIIARYLI